MIHLHFDLGTECFCVCYMPFSSIVFCAVVSSSHSSYWNSKNFLLISLKTKTCFFPESLFLALWDSRLRFIHLNNWGIENFQWFRFIGMLFMFYLYDHSLPKRMLSKLKCRLMRMRFIGDTERKMKSWNGHLIPPT